MDDGQATWLGRSSCHTLNAQFSTPRLAFQLLFTLMENTVQQRKGPPSLNEVGWLGVNGCAGTRVAVVDPSSNMTVNEVLPGPNIAVAPSPAPEIPPCTGRTGRGSCSGCVNSSRRSEPDEKRCRPQEARRRKRGKVRAKLPLKERPAVK